MLFKDISALGYTPAADGIDIIIGMDIISKGDLFISNSDKKTKLFFRCPSIADLDF